MRSSRTFKGTLIMLAALASLGGAREAKAAAYTINDNLEVGGWNVWSSNPAQGGGYVAPWGAARSPTRAGYVYFYQPAGSADWLQFYKGFSTGVTPISCSASVYLRGYGGPGATPSNHGTVEMLDTTTWTYIGVKSFANITPYWTKVTVTNTYACTKNITLRVVLGAHPGYWDMLFIDDASVTWNY